MNFSSLYSSWVSQRHLTGLRRQLEQVNEQEDQISGLTDDDIRLEFSSMQDLELAARAVRGIALVREAAKRSLGLRPFDVQILAGLALLQGKVAEMKTGEGKTLTVAAPAALMALDGRGVHVVTSNTYLAARDAETLRPLYEFLGLSVSSVPVGASVAEKQAAYACDVTYSVNFELGFDFLRDSLSTSPEARVQRARSYVIVDELDSILIDDARTPLILSGLGPDNSDICRQAWAIVRTLTPGEHFHVNEKEHAANLTDAGWARVETLAEGSGLIPKKEALYSGEGLALAKRMEAAVKARTLYRRDRDYLVHDGQVVLVDRGTGRSMAGRRLEESLHEMLEAKEGVEIKASTVAAASISYQAYFGGYGHLCGLTGTAFTSAEELLEIYNLPVVQIPTHRPSQKKFLPDRLFVSQEEKLAHAVALLREKQLKGQPVLVGCGSIKEATAASLLLTRSGIPHETLTARHAESEANIIARAGLPGAITVATHMAGRGTDILLGGPKPSAEDGEASMAAYLERQEQVRAAGGLVVLALERNGIRRVDEQLAGRCGRQGDPGEVQFLLSLDDELLRVHAGSTALKALAGDLGLAAAGLVNKVISRAQQRIEEEGFTTRKELLKYDQVANSQRDAFFRLRDEAMDPAAARERCRLMVTSALSTWFDEQTQGGYIEAWPLAEMKASAQQLYGLRLPLLRWTNGPEDLTEEDIRQKVLDMALQQLELLPDSAFGPALRAGLDAGWPEHMAGLSELRLSSNLAAKSGKNPLLVYQHEAFAAFTGFLGAVEKEVSRHLLNIGDTQEAAPGTLPGLEQPSAESKALAAVAREKRKRWIGRNEACPCGSGKRFRQCHGQLP